MTSIVKVTIYSAETKYGKRYGIKEVETGRDPWGGHNSARWTRPEGAAAHAKHCGFELATD